MTRIRLGKGIRRVVNYQGTGIGEAIIRYGYRINALAINGNTPAGLPIVPIIGISRYFGGTKGGYSSPAQ
jgi:hypothetical protein